MTGRREMGFKTQKRKGSEAGPVRKEELLAKSVTIDGRKEWYCRFCSETNVAVEVPQVPDRYSVCVTRWTHSSSVNKEWTQLVSIIVFG